MTPTGWLDGDVAFITGGGSGIGRAVALRFLREGAKGVAVFGRSLDRLHSVAEEAGDLGDRVLAIEGDVRSAADLAAGSRRPSPASAR